MGFASVMFLNVAIAVFHSFYATLAFSMVGATLPLSGRTGWLGIIKMERIAEAEVAAVRPLESRMS